MARISGARRDVQRRATVVTLLIGVMIYIGLMAIGFVVDRVIIDDQVMRSATGSRRRWGST